MELKKEDFKKYVPLVIILLLIVLSFLMIKSFILPLVTAFILAYLIKPVHNFLSKKLSNSLSAVISIIIIFLIILVPFAGMITGVITQSSTILRSQEFKVYLTKLSELEIISSLNLDLNIIINKSLSFIVSQFSNLASSIASAIVGLFITIIGMYYIIYDWDALTKRVTKYLPSKNKEALAKKMASITKKLIYGTFLIAVIEFAVAAVGFGIFGVKSYLLLGALIGLFAFIPAAGAGLVWVPLFAILIIQKSYLSAIGVLITGLVISVGIDTLLRAKLSGKTTGIHPLIILLGIFGGISLFGISGLVIGPLILSYTIKIIEELVED